MKHVLAVTLVLIVTASPAEAQEQQKSLASTLEVYAFPKDGQAADQQSKDEAACYDWAVSNTGSDPFQLRKDAQQDAHETEQEMQEAGTTKRGAGASGAVRGAAAGALVGEIASDDAGEGAAWGAAAGIISARRHARRASANAQIEAAEQGAEKQQSTAEKVDNFKKAFSVCLEAKEYLVKY